MQHRYFQNIPFFLSVSVVLMLVMASCDENNIYTPDYSMVEEARDTTDVERFEASNGLVIYFHEHGTGELVAENDAVRVFYTGRTTDGEVFDSSFRDGNTTPSTLQVRGMIRGFMQGLAGVHIDGERRHTARVGAVRTLVIPPELGYAGTNNSLREDTLLFEVEIVEIASID